MKNYKKNIISIVILLCIVLILYFTPPIMLADGWIEFGSRADSFETHMLDEYNNFPFRREASNSDFDNFYFINLRIWEKITSVPLDTLMDTFSEFGRKCQLLELYMMVTKIQRVN